MNEALINGADINGTGAAAGSGNGIFITLDGYAVSARVLNGVFDATLDLQGYAVTAAGVIVDNQGGALELDGYAVTAEVYGGAFAQLDGYAVSADGFMVGREGINLAADGYAVSAALAAGSRNQANLAAQGYAVTAEAYGGAALNVSGYAVSAAITTTGRAGITVALGGYAVTAEAVMTSRSNASLALQGYAVSAEAYGGAALQVDGYAVSAAISLAGVALEGYGQALAMNTHTAEVSRYTQYDFMSLVMLDGKPYGVRHDGIYRLSENHDETGLNGRIVTKCTDFGSFQSKRVPYCYLNNDSKVIVTPTVDDVEKLPHESQFLGRKVHLARGPSGRYWQFKIETIKQLEGVEFAPQLAERRRRVK